MKDLKAWWFGIALVMPFFSLKALAFDPVTASAFAAYGSAFSPLATSVGTATIVAEMSTAGAGAAAVFTASGATAAVTAAVASEAVYASSAGAVAYSTLGAQAGAITATLGSGTVAATEAAGTLVALNGVYQTAQSGVVVNGILRAASSAMTGGAYLGLLWLGYEAGSRLMDYMVNPATSDENLSSTSLADFKSLSTKSADWINVAPISATDVARREYQLKAAMLEGCPQSSFLPAMAYCVSGAAMYKVTVPSYQDSVNGGYGDLINKTFELPGNQIESTITSYLRTDAQFMESVVNENPYSKDFQIKSFTIYEPVYDLWTEYESQVLITYQTKSCSSCSYYTKTYEVYPLIEGIESSSSKCPAGTEFTLNLWSEHVQVCEPNFQEDGTKSKYAIVQPQLGYPHYEVLPSGQIQVHPIVSNQISQSNLTGVPKTFSVDSTISSDKQSVGFLKPANQYVDTDIQVTSTLDSIIVSKTFKNFKMKHRDGTDFTLKIREVLKYSMSSLTLVARELSYETSDGSKLKPDDTFMSPYTFGSPDLALSPTFNVDPVPRFDIGTQTGTQTGTQITPCGLGIQDSLPCQINWGNSPDVTTVPDFPTKKPNDLIPFYIKLKDWFGTVNWFPVSSQCSIPSIDLSSFDSDVLRPFAKEWKLDFFCKLCTKYQDFIRLLSMIGWFLLSLWIVLDA